MKKFLAAILALCLVFSGFISLKGRDSNASAFAESAPADAAAETAEEAVEEAAPAVPIVLDFDKLYASHAPEDVIMDIDGELITWDSYYFYLFMQANQMLSSLQQMQMYYGISYGWDEVIDEEGTTVSDLTVANSVEMLKQYKAIEKMAKENNIELDEEALASIAARLNSDKKAACGEDATDEQFAELLANEHIKPSDFEYAYTISALYTAGQAQLYGENGDKVSDEDTLKFMNDNGFLYATHILFATVDTATGEALDEAAVAEKKAKAEEVSAQLRAITDEKELVETFAKLKAELCDDTGKTVYPDGYVFLPGEMVPEFENAVVAAENYAVTEPVESSYGYHVIMRLPLDPNAGIEVNSDGSFSTGHNVAAAAMYADKLQAIDDALVILDRNGYVAPKLGEFVK